MSEVVRFICSLCLVEMSPSCQQPCLVDFQPRSLKRLSPCLPPALSPDPSLPNLTSAQKRGAPGATCRLEASFHTSAQGWGRAAGRGTVSGTSVVSPGVEEGPPSAHASPCGLLWGHCCDIAGFPSVDTEKFDDDDEENPERRQRLCL